MNKTFVEVETHSEYARNGSMWRAGPVVSVGESTVSFNWDGTVETVDRAEILGMNFYRYENDPRRVGWQRRVEVD
jgi:hypothetical protein